MLKSLPKYLWQSSAELMHANEKKPCSVGKIGTQMPMRKSGMDETFEGRFAQARCLGQHRGASVRAFPGIPAITIVALFSF
jgi:hypothetical protein